MAGSMQGKVALVTGGSMGIGRATSLVFAREGARVVIQDLDSPGGEETVAKVREAGSEGVFVRGDVSKTDDVQAAVEKAVDTYGRLDYAFNNAAPPNMPGPMHEYDEDAWDLNLAVLLKGVWLGMKYQIRHMLENGGGAIVNTSSIFGQVGNVAGNCAYVAAKHGVLGLTRSAALEYGKRGIRINAVCPGNIHTRRLVERDPDGGYIERLTLKYPIGRLGESNEVAEAVVWLCSDAASFVHGHVMAVDGGYLAQ